MTFLRKSLVSAVFGLAHAHILINGFPAAEVPRGACLTARLGGIDLQLGPPHNTVVCGVWGNGGSTLPLMGSSVGAPSHLPSATRSPTEQSHRSRTETRNVAAFGTTRIDGVRRTRPLRPAAQKHATRMRGSCPIRSDRAWRPPRAASRICLRLAVSHTHPAQGDA